MRTKYLSYFIDSSTPLYGGAKDIIIKNKTSIGNGDSSNTMILNIPNHAGTHIDFPLHFIENGKSCNDYKSDFWIFNNPYLLNKKVDEVNKKCSFCCIKYTFYIPFKLLVVSLLVFPPFCLFMGVWGIFCK